MRKLNKRREIFKECSRALRAASSHGTCTERQKAYVEQARLALLDMVRDLTNSKNQRILVYMEGLMRDLHPRTEYCRAMIIRDLADVCVTLKRVTQDRRRTDHMKIVDAMMCCKFLGEEAGT